LLYEVEAVYGATSRYLPKTIGLFTSLGESILPMFCKHIMTIHAIAFLVWQRSPCLICSTSLATLNTLVASDLGYSRLMLIILLPRIIARYSIIHQTVTSSAFDRFSGIAQHHYQLSTTISYRLSIEFITMKFWVLYTNRKPC
jgi:hypothetical protein